MNYLECFLFCPDHVFIGNGHGRRIPVRSSTCALRAARPSESKASVVGPQQTLNLGDILIYLVEFRAQQEAGRGDDRLVFRVRLVEKDWGERV